MSKEPEVKILPELKDFITPLTKEEYEQLEENIKSEGCRDPLTVWNRDGEYILVDGHNRYKICLTNDVEYTIEMKDFSSMEEAKDWMIDNQLGRRNLNPFQLSYFRGYKYERLKKKKGGYQYVLSKGQSGTPTSEKLADAFKVSKNTIKRDAQFTKGLEVIGVSNPKLKQDILSGDKRVNRGLVQLISEADPRTKVHNVKDLKVKAEKIKKKKDDKKKEGLPDEPTPEERAREIFNEQGIEFIKDRDQRVQRTKANILSSINRIINNKDKEAMADLKKYVMLLEKDVFDLETA
ncbi:ParB N-terminal domain-containing protein [Chondrinema litorale]|uniref:ParB N-terminal domain-containing protein n=1 Tax=Chondrinema litorale TaxID=2994555 RepID=UPI0025433579|nr:ParB N-terminal domain-containing protein [Chondrinema litorale]UZS00192.1 ParB N-terminal domain-containing protein [Chondrinema litorale]